MHKHITGLIEDYFCQHYFATKQPKNRYSTPIYRKYQNPYWVVLKEALRLLAIAVFLYTIFWIFWRDQFEMSFDDLVIPPIKTELNMLPFWLFLGASLVVNVLLGIYRIVKKAPQHDDPFEFLKLGLWTGIIAGVVEEIIFRGLIFLVHTVSLKFLDWATFGLVQIFIAKFMIPIANFMTLGILEEYLYSESSWLIGGALLTSTALFRNEHSYQGPIGYVISWFAGIFLFWITFKHGLGYAIIAHIGFNVAAFSSTSILMNFQPAIRIYK